MNKKKMFSAESPAHSGRVDTLNPGPRGRQSPSEGGSSRRLVSAKLRGVAGSAVPKPERKSIMLKKMISIAAVAGLVLALAPAAQAMDMVTVGDAGNDPDGTGYGAVAYTYRIGKYEVRNAQYCDFLNTVGKSTADTYGLYNSSMGSDPGGGISLSGSTYSTRSNMADKPVNFVCWYDAIRFANWMTAGATESGSYTISGGGVNSGSVAIPDAAQRAAWAAAGDRHVMLTSEDEWYKAAYYKGGGTNAGYWDYPTGSDTAPTAVQAVDTGDTYGNVGDGRDGVDGGGTPPGTNTPVMSGNFANYNNVADWNGLNGNVTTVGTNGGPNPYGMFDQAGNVWEWNEAVIGSNRGFRGGAYNSYASHLTAGWRAHYAPPANEYGTVGFRVSQVPEPATLALLALGGVWVLGRRRNVR